MKVALLDIRGDILQSAAAEFQGMGGDVLPITVDLSDAADTQAAIDTVLTQYGTPRVLIHNAALLITRSMLEITLAQWQMEINIILQAAFILEQSRLAADESTLGAAASSTSRPARATGASLKKSPTTLASMASKA